MDLKELIYRIPEGSSRYRYRDRTYLVTKKIFNGGKSYKVFAEELEGNDFISFNFYETTASEFFKPCEMPPQKVLNFLQNAQVLG